MKNSIFTLFKSVIHFDKEFFVCLFILKKIKTLYACVVDKRETILENLTLSVAFVHGKFEYLMQRRK